MTIQNFHSEVQLFPVKGSETKYQQLLQTIESSLFPSPIPIIKKKNWKNFNLC